jgi:hypothetical protein
MEMQIEVTRSLALMLLLHFIMVHLFTRNLADHGNKNGFERLDDAEVIVVIGDPVVQHEVHRHGLLPRIASIFVDVPDPEATLLVTVIVWQ